jgi:hypothetical protein
MRHLMLAASAVSLTACISAHSKPPVTQVAESPASLCAMARMLDLQPVEQGEVFVVHGAVITSLSTCGAAKEGQSPKCDLTAPRYVVNGKPLWDRASDLGAVFGEDSTCAKPASPSNDTRH